MSINDRFLQHFNIILILQARILCYNQPINNKYIEALATQKPDILSAFKFSNPRNQQIEHAKKETEQTRKEVSRLPWRFLKISRNSKAYRLGLLTEALFLVSTYVFIHFITAQISKIDAFRDIVFARGYILAFFILIILINFILDVVDWTSKEYILQSGCYVYINDFIDLRIGKIIIKRGLAFQSTQIYPMNAFIKVEYRQSIIGKCLFYGTVYLHTKDGSSVRLSKIKNPALYTNIIQQMIDDASYEKFIEKN